jgi:sortase A
MRRALRVVGTLLIVGGLGLLLWVVLVWRWQDPFTAVYTRVQQHRLSGQYDKLFDSYHTTPIAKEASVASERAAVRAEAARYRRSTHRGQAIGRLTVPRLGLDGMVLVNGTDHDSLTRGPGRDERTFMPGQGQLVYVAGHRTTYLAPFSHIDSLRRGDTVTLALPYATIVYRITHHRIVAASDLSVLKSHGREVLILQACHPRFFATHRYLAYAEPVRVTPRDGVAYTPEPVTKLAVGG